VETSDPRVTISLKLWALQYFLGSRFFSNDSKLCTIIKRKNRTFSGLVFPNVRGIILSKSSRQST
jgi:hypothetical protein